MPSPVPDPASGYRPTLPAHEIDRITRWHERAYREGLAVGRVTLLRAFRDGGEISYAFRLGARRAGDPEPDADSRTALEGLLDDEQVQTLRDWFERGDLARSKRGGETYGARNPPGGVARAWRPSPSSCRGEHGTHQYLNR